MPYLGDQRQLLKQQWMKDPFHQMLENWLSITCVSCLLCVGAYVMRGRWLSPLAEALCENPDLQLIIPMRTRRAPPLPPPPNPSMCELLLDMLDIDPDARPTADQLEERVQCALKLHWSKHQAKNQTITFFFFFTIFAKLYTTKEGKHQTTQYTEKLEDKAKGTSRTGPTGVLFVHLKTDI